MMYVSYPRKRTGDANGHKNIGNDTSDKYRFMIVLMVDGYQSHSVDELDKSWRGAAEMNALKMLQNGGTAEAKQERCPLVAE